MQMGKELRNFEREHLLNQETEYRAFGQHVSYKYINMYVYILL